MTGGTVFVVDDDAPVRLSVARLLRALGYESRTFDSAESFLAGHQGARGCLLVDIRMPGMSGLDLLEELARRRASLPAIVMSGHVDAGALLRPGIEIVGVLEKPFSLDALRQLLARWQAEFACETDRGGPSASPSRPRAITPALSAEPGETTGARRGTGLQDR
jgi:FixJ family two-component response regulator